MNIEMLSDRQRQKYAEEAEADIVDLQAKLEVTTHRLERNQIQAQIFNRRAIIKKLREYVPPQTDSIPSNGDVSIP